MPTFKYIGIDYSGAGKPTTRSATIQAYACQGRGSPRQVVLAAAPGGRRRHWNREELYGWLVSRLRSEGPTIVGIDHGFGFPQSYYSRYQIGNWDQFLETFRDIWPTDQPSISVEDIRRTVPTWQGDARELRLTERWTAGAKSVFLFDVQGSVAKSTHAGLPWLKRLRDDVGERLHFWPFDGWLPPADRSVIAEVFPSLFRRRYPADGRTVDQQDAYSVARWLSEMDGRDRLRMFFQPPLGRRDASVARREGWILGVM